MYIMRMAISPQPMLEEDVIGDPAIYPDAATLKPLHNAALSAKSTAPVTRMWTKIKSGT